MIRLILICLSSNINIETYLSRTQINNMYIQNEKIYNHRILTDTIHLNSLQKILLRGDDNDGEISDDYNNTRIAVWVWRHRSIYFRNIPEEKDKC